MIDLHLKKWQNRWQNSEKGSRTKGIIPGVMNRYVLVLKLDHFTSQMMNGHSDFREKLHKFKLVKAPSCPCRNGSETVQHVFYCCPRTHDFHIELQSVMESEDEP